MVARQLFVQSVLDATGVPSTGRQKLRVLLIRPTQAQPHSVKRKNGLVEHQQAVQKHPVSASGESSPINVSPVELQWYPSLLVFPFYCISWPLSSLI